MSSIPDDIIFRDILSRLPVKSLLVCKSVCKIWYSVISNPNFVNTHLSLNTQKSNFINLTSESFDDLRSIYEYSVHSVCHESLPVPDFQDCCIFSSPLRTLISLLCSCNGLVCLIMWTPYKQWTVIWNPATREYKKLPEPPITSRTSRESLIFYECALGYDCKINDYKFVIFVELDKWTHEILVYTLGSNSWKKIKIISCTRIDQRSPGVLVSEAFHWIGNRNEDHSRFIISFDISNERYNDIQLPSEALDEGWCVSLGVVEGCLCVVHAVLYSNDDEVLPVHQRQVTVWVMQEYGVRESWTKRHIINHERIMKNNYHLWLFWCYKNGEILFGWRDFHDAVIYDPKHGSVREVNLKHTIHGVSYFETLVSLQSGMYLGRNGEIELPIEDEKRNPFDSRRGGRKRRI